jgi:hypothetical protein
MTLTAFSVKFYSWIETKSTKKAYPFYLTLTLIGISLFLAFPRYDQYDYNRIIAWDVTMLKAHDLTNNLIQFAADSLFSKKVFRLTVPILIRLLHLNKTGILILQGIVGFFFIFFSYKLANRILKDAVSATMIAAGIMFMYAGRACFVDVSTYFDGWAYFFILMTIYSRNLALTFLFATMAAWVDERGALALVFPLLFHQVNAAKEKDFSLRALTRPSQPTIVVLAAIAGYLSLRLYLTHAFNMHTPTGDADFSAFKMNFIHASYGFGAFTFLEGFWLLVPIVALLAITNGHYSFLLAILGVMGGFSLAVFFVYDLTRSGSHLVASIFILLLYLQKFTQLNFIRTVSLICLFFCFIFPPINYVAFGDFLYRVDKPFFWIVTAMLQQQ